MHAAKLRVEGLNPQVVVETVPSLEILDDDELDATVQTVDLVCVTDWNRAALVRQFTGFPAVF